MKKLKMFFKGFKFIFFESPLNSLILLLLTALEGVVPALLALIMRNMVDAVIGGISSQAFFSKLIALWLIAMVVQHAISMLLRFVIDTYNVKISYRTGTAIIQKRLSILGVAVFEQEEFQKIYGRLAETQYRIENFVNNFRYWFKSIIEFVSIFVLFLSFEFWVPIAIFISILPGIFTARKISKIQVVSEDKIYDIERESAYYRNVLIKPNVAREIRLFELGDLFFSKFKNKSRELISRNKQFRKKIALFDFLGISCRITVVAVIMFILSWKAADGGISAGLLAMFLQSVFTFSTAMMTIIEFWAYQDSAIAFFARLFDFLNMKECLQISKTPQKFSGKIETIEFQSVNFSYNNEKQVLKNISFKINANEIVALVGENGAGKTTITKLIARFYDPTAGKILVNGIDLKEIDLKEYQKAISAVFQDYMKYNLTVKENILGSDDNKKIEFTDIVDLNFINDFEQKENTLLGTYFGGTELSGGQWQRLAIVRALNKEHSLLIVDEPTASIDPIQEREIYNSLLQNSVMQILVTHRLGSIKKANKILVLKDGELIASGNHDELMKTNPYYNELYSSQADMYK